MKDKLKTLLKNKKVMIPLIISFITIIALGITYAYMAPEVQDVGETDIDVNSLNTDELTFTSGDELTIVAEQQNFAQGLGNLSQETVGVAKLVANKGNRSASMTYNIYLDIHKNNFVYTTEDNKTELILTVTDPDGSEVTSIEGLNYVTAGDVTGFDITTKSGLTNIKLNHLIESTSTTKGTIQTWKFKVTFINLDTNQQANTGKAFRAEVMMTKGEYVEPNAYAIYSETDNSLRFYNNRDIVSVGDTYKDLVVTKKYTEFSNQVFDNKNNVSWSDVKWDVKIVSIEEEISPISTAYWFYEFYEAGTINLTNLDTSKVTNMSNMFAKASMYLEDFNIIGLSGFNTSQVTDMSSMFYMSGRDSNRFNLGDLSNWNVSKVTNMSLMFNYAGSSSTEWEIGSLSNWNVSSVSNMHGMFYEAAINVEDWSIGELNNWNVSNVTDMSFMFAYTAKNTTNWYVGDLTSWNVSNVSNFNSMFNESGYNSTSWSIGNISSWITTSAIKMTGMFYKAGYSASYTINLSNWQVPLVSEYENFNGEVTTKVIAPTWVN